MTTPASQLQTFSPPVLPTEVTGMSIPSYLRSGKAFFLGRQVLIYDCTGAFDSVLYNPEQGQVGRSLDFRFGSYDTRCVALLSNRFLIGQGRTGLRCYDLETRRAFSLPRSSVGQCVGSALLMTGSGLYEIGGKDVGNNSLRYHCLHYPWNNIEHLRSENWQTLPEIIMARTDATAIQLNGKIFLFGGYHWNRDRVRYTACNKTEVFDGERWSFGPDLHFARVKPCVVAMGSVIFVLGGECEGEVVDAVEVWNLETNAFCVWRRLEQPRRDVSAVMVNHEIFLFCGNSTAVEKMSIHPEELTREALAPLLRVQSPTAAPSTSPMAPVTSDDSPADRLDASASEETDAVMENDIKNMASLFSPTPPVRPNMPIVTSIPQRYGALQKYIGQLEKVEEQYRKFLLTTTERIADAYAHARDRAIDDLNFQGQLWLSDTERLLTHARQEAQSLEDRVRKEKNFVEHYLGVADDDDYEDDIPSQLRCPITLNLMVDPVVAADGNTYDRHSLELWFQSSRNTTPLSPLTGAQLPSTNYYPVHTLKALCQQFVKIQEDKRRMVSESEGETDDVL